MRSQISGSIAKNKKPPPCIHKETDIRGTTLITAYAVTQTFNGFCRSGYWPECSESGSPLHWTRIFTNHSLSVVLQHLLVSSKLIFR